MIYFQTGQHNSAAIERIGSEIGLDFAINQKVIDENKSALAIDQSLSQLEIMATQKGYAIGIGSALPLTIQRINQWAIGLKKRGFYLVPISTFAHKNKTLAGTKNNAI